MVSQGIWYIEDSLEFAGTPKVYQILTSYLFMVAVIDSSFRIRVTLLILVDYYRLQLPSRNKNPFKEGVNVRILKYQTDVTIGSVYQEIIIRLHGSPSQRGTIH